MTAPTAPTRPDASTRSRLLAPADVDLLSRAAGRAPSLHNSQPWAFAFGPRHVELYADATRQLRHADPSGRSLLVSCGAALLNLRVAAEHAGFHPRVRVLPQATEPTLVALVEVDHRHRPRQPGALDHLYPAIEARRTNRRPFHDRRIPTSVLATLAEAARTEGAMLRVYDDPDEVSRLISLLHEAELTEHGDPARAIENQAWVGGKRRVDGVPLSALGPRPTQRRAAYRDLGHSVGGVRDHASFEAAPTLAVLSTTQDRPADWVRAGQALERLLLEATTAGVAASFVNPPLEQEQLRWLVRSPQTGVGHSQMILRLGYGDAVPATPRRPPEQLRSAPRVP